MSINFPNNPAINDTFTSNGLTYEFDGDKWTSVVDLTASAVEYDPTVSGLTATDVQAAVDEIKDESVAKSGDTMTGALTLPANGLTVGTDQLVATGGNVGIGTTSPAVRLFGRALSINGTTQSSIELLTGGASAGELFSNSTGTNICEFRDLPMRFRTSNTERMQIDTTGRVTMPFQPAFQAMIVSSTSGNTTVVAGGVLPYSSVRYDRNNNYNSSTHRFTAPVTGVYAIGFSVSYLRNATVGRRAIGLRVNGSLREYVDFTPNQDYDLVELSTLLNLSTNDFVDVRFHIVQSTDQYWGGAGGGSPVGSFRGFLVG